MDLHGARYILLIFVMPVCREIPIFGLARRLRSRGPDTGSHGAGNCAGNCERFGVNGRAGETEKQGSVMVV